MKLALIIATLSSGGAERVMADMANYWVRSGWKVSLITFSGEELEDFYPISSAVDRIKLGLHKPSSHPLGKLLSNIQRIMTLRRVLHQLEPDAVISFLDVNNILTLLATRRMGVRVIVSERTNPAVNPFLGKFWQILRQRMYQFADSVVAQTQDAATWIEGVCGAETTVIPNPLRTLPEIDAKRQLMLLSVGRLDPYKGFDVVLRAFARVRCAFPDWKLVILGEGPERSVLESLSDQLGLQDVVQMPGTVSDPEVWMAQAGLVVQASRFEGFPNVLLEAMGMGAAVISSNCRSGPSDIIADGINGRLVPVNDVDTLAQAMADLMSNPDLRETLGQAARTVKYTFKQDVIMSQWNTLLERKVK